MKLLGLAYAYIQSSENIAIKLIRDISGRKVAAICNDRVKCERAVSVAFFNFICCLLSRAVYPDTTLAGIIEIKHKCLIVFKEATLWPLSSFLTGDFARRRERRRKYAIRF